MLGGPLQTLSEDEETKLQGQDMARTEVERECTWRGQHTAQAWRLGSRSQLTPL